MARAAYAAKTYFAFKTIIPCHYRTFPALEQSAKALADKMKSGDAFTLDDFLMQLHKPCCT